MYGYRERTTMTYMEEHKTYKQVSIKCGTDEIADSMFVMKKEVDDVTVSQSDIIACCNRDKVKQKFFDYQPISSLQIKAKEKVYRFEYAPPDLRYAYYVVYRKELMYVFTTYIWNHDAAIQYFVKESRKKKEFNTTHDLMGIHVFDHDFNYVHQKVVDHTTMQYTLEGWKKEGFEEKDVQGWMDLATNSKVLVKKVGIVKQKPTIANWHNKSSYKDKYLHNFTFTMKDANVQGVSVDALHEIIKGASNRYTSDKIKVYKFIEDQKLFFVLPEGREPKVVVMYFDTSNIITRVDDPSNIALWRDKEDMKKKWAKIIPNNVSHLSDFVGYKLIV
jgi:hypothetical protein